MGNFDVVKLESLYHVPEKFLTLKPMALKAHLASRKYVLVLFSSKIFIYVI